MADGWRGIAADLAQAVRFSSRLPVPALPFESEPHAAPEAGPLARLLPLAAVILAVLPALVLIAALDLRLGAFLAAALCVATAVAVTGALHEDGLADAADGLFGGRDPEARLAIMRDSRLGTFGAAALALALVLRIGALAGLAERLPTGRAVAALVCAFVVSRAAALVPLTLLPPARPDGLAASVGRPQPADLRTALILAFALTLAFGLSGGLPMGGLVVMAGLSGLAGWLVTRLADRLVGGQTGDIAGAAQQLAEIAALIGLLAAVEP